jgi:hypothetical protein
MDYGDRGASIAFRARLSPTSHENENARCVDKI